MFKKFHYLDYYILVPYLLLSAIGVVMVYSASSYWIKAMYHQAENSVMIKQLIFVIIGLFVALFFYYFKIKLLQKPGWQLVLLTLVFAGLAYLFLLGRLHPAAAINGATAWIQLGPINIQPTEFAKLAVILYLAHMFTRRQPEMETADFSIKKLASPLILVALLIALTLLQPDTGGAMILAGIAAVMLAASGISLVYGIGGASFIAALVFGLYWLVSHFQFPTLINKYWFRRILAVMHPFKMVKTDGRQLVNSMVAIRHGGLFGVGLGNSSQKLGYLPEPYTDFILSVIAEELGIVGACVIVGMIFFLILRFYLIGIRSKNTYYALISYGIATMMLIQTSFNVGGVLGFLPITGVTLPFISYGGSSCLVLAACMGIMLNISASEKATKEAALHPGQ